MDHFTPTSALAGGALIGLAAVVLMLFHGRIAGISGIVGGLLTPRAGDVAWRAAFVIGMLAGAAALAAAGFAPVLRDRPALAIIILAGLLVGFGTRLGSGCTSGHGVCGLARLSPRSLAATLVFMASGAAAVFVARHVLGIEFMNAIVMPLIAGLLFGAELTVSQMVDPAKVQGFLDFAGIADGRWDPSLAFVMAGALAVTAIGYRLAFRRPAPLMAAQFALPTRKDIDARLVAGAAIFGAGWGLAGYCPGPAVASLAFGNAEVLAFVVAMLVGMGLFQLVVRPSAAPAGQAAPR